MKVYRLAPGMVFRNYRELCEELGVPVKNGGKSKVYQLKEWERYFKFHKDGFKIVIDDIYKETMPKENDKKKYKELLTPLIIHAIKISKKQEVMYFTPISLLQYIGVYDRESILFEGATFRDSREVSKKLGISQQTVEDFYYYINAKSREIIQSSLKVVSQAEGVEIDRSMMLVSRGEFIEATHEQYELIRGLEQELLDKKHLKNHYQLYRSYTAKTFNPIVLRQFEEKMHIPNIRFDYYYRLYKLQVKGDRKELPKNHIKGKQELIREELTRVICNHTRKVSMSRQNEFGNSTDFRGSLRYRREIYKLSQVLLKKS